RRPPASWRADPRRQPRRVPPAGGRLMAERERARPLAGIKVLEFSHTVMGPGVIFAKLGADVIKIEPATNGDHTPGLGGFGAGFFEASNRQEEAALCSAVQFDARVQLITTR